MECKYCNREIGDRDPEECMRNPHRELGDPSTDTRPEYQKKSENETIGNKSASVTGLVCPSCGWAGSDLKKKGCVTDADEWYVCLECGLDGSKMRRTD